MAVAEANYGRLGTRQAPFYMRSIAEQLDLEMPGALPEISPSPEYDPFVDFRDRAMFMQAWSSYEVQWPVIHHFLGIRPDVPAKSISVVPDVPDSWPGLSVQNLRVGNGTVAESAEKRRDRLEYLDLAGLILNEPVRVEDGNTVIPSSPGTGVEWDEESVRRYLMD
jgi:hypothetical protein